MNKIRRRSFLQGAAAASALTATGALDAAHAQSTTPSKLSDIDHIIILMKENRSFDHYFGTLARRARFRRSDGAQSRTAARCSVRRTRSIPTGTCCRSVSTRCDTRGAAPARSQPRLGPPARKPGTAAPWTIGLPRTAPADGDARSADHGLSHPRGPSLLLRARRRLHDLRRLSLLGVRADRSQPLLSDDGHDRSERPRTAVRRSTMRGTAYSWETYPERLERGEVSAGASITTIDDYDCNVLKHFMQYPASAAGLAALSRTPWRTGRSTSC